MNDRDLLRYSRHILLNEIGVEGQAAIRASSMLVLGAGGLGSPASFYLASAGVGRITLVDDDRVDLTNLQRQILHTVERIGAPKAESGRLTLAGINPEVEVVPDLRRVGQAELDELVAAHDIVLDCSDNFATRHAANRACVRHARPLVSGAAIRFAVMGVFAPLTGIIGTVQAAEALKLAAGAGEPLVGRLLMLEALAMRWHTVRVPRDPGCPVCTQRAAAADAIRATS
jgi:molybdopterin/thiamine biosynthesis adenylyltransferase